MNFVTKRCIRKSIRLLLWWTHYSFPGISVAGPKELFALELLPTEYCTPPVVPATMFANKSSLKTPALFALRDEPLRGRITKLNTGLTILTQSHIFFVSRPSSTDFALLARRLRYWYVTGGHLGFICTEGAGVGSKPSTARRPLSRFDTHPRWPPVTQSLRTEP